MTTKVRAPEVAGLFYPADKDQLDFMVRAFLADASGAGEPAKALIVPHAGYVYSGPVAASGYARVKGQIDRVVLIGTAHRYSDPGLVSHSADYFATPLGRVELDKSVFPLPHTIVLDDAHEGEHSLEVHLPFLQVVVGEFKLVPLLVGDATPEQAAEVLEAVWGGPETLIVVSSDLSHYHDCDTARKLDEGTAAAIEAGVRAAVGPRQACGCRAIGGLMEIAKRKNLRVETVDLRNSGDTAGGRDSVVGYGAFVFRPWP